MSGAAVLVSQFDAPALRKELGDVPKHVRVVTRPPRKAGKETLLLATTEAVTKSYQRVRSMLVHDMNLVLFGKVERDELLNALQDIALLAADRPVAP